MPDDAGLAILLIEDEPLVRLFLSDLLIDAGFRIVETANAGEALTVLEAGIRVSVILADVDMPPGIDGYELARQVHERWPHIEILMTSGRRWPVEGDLPPGAAFLAKPCPNDAIISHVQAASERVDARRSRDDYGRVVPFPLPKTA
jgi:CheY-like chemotaxis protein